MFRVEDLELREFVHGFKMSRSFVFGVLHLQGLLLCSEFRVLGEELRI